METPPPSRQKVRYESIITRKDIDWELTIKQKKYSSQKKKAITKYVGEIPKSVQQAINDFEIPTELSQFSVCSPTGKLTDSLGYLFGIFIENPLGSKFYICKASEECRNATASIDLHKTGPQFGIFNVSSATSTPINIKNISL